MILEAFADYLHDCNPDSSAPKVLSRWLWEKLTQPPQSAIDKVIHEEIEISRNVSLSVGSRRMGVTYTFAGASPSGRKLLSSLYEYALSYEQQRWSRWVHQVKASDFCN
jgi:hypothetical protein